MNKQPTLERSEPKTGILTKADNLWFRAVLFLIALAAFGLVAMPILTPMLTGASSEWPADAFSHIVRSSAFVAYILIWMSMLAGLSITSKAGRKWRGMSWSFGLHRYMTLLGLGFAFTHALALLGDKYMNYTLAQVAVPFMAGSYKTQWLGLGQVALYSLAVVALSFYVRNRLGVRAWRMVHSLSFALFLMALIHGLQSGSDSASWWAGSLYWVSGLSVLLGSAYRVMASRTGRARHKAAATGLVAIAGRAQIQPMPRVLRVENLDSQPTI